jgi:hypothetical protein
MARRNSCQTGCFISVLAFALFGIWLCSTPTKHHENRREVSHWTPRPYTSPTPIEHSAAWQDGYEVGRLHYQNHEAFPGVMQSQNLRDFKGEEWFDGYTKGFFDAQDGR